MQTEYIQSLFNHPSGDLVIHCGDKRFYAHKLFLASSPYCERKFNTSIGKPEDKNQMTISHELVFYVGIAAFYLKKKPALGDVLTMTAESFKILCEEAKMMDCPVDWDDLLNRIPSEIHTELVLNDADFVLTHFPEKEDMVFEFHVEHRGLEATLNDPVFSQKTKLAFTEKAKSKAKADEKNKIFKIYSDMEVDEDTIMKYYLTTKNYDFLNYLCKQ
jgi:hypothetical protein